MKAEKSSLKKVAPCLYRNTTTGSYCAIVKKAGKQNYQNLETKQLAEARRKLLQFRRDLEQLKPRSGRVTFLALADTYLETIKHQAKSTQIGKIGVIRRIKTSWPLPPDRDAGRITGGEVRAFLAQYKGQSRNRQALNVLREIFEIARSDGHIARSPVDGIRQRKVVKNPKLTPSFEQFQQIVQSIRDQPYSDTAEESADFVEFMGLAGLGQAEVSTLKWESIDFARQRIQLFRHKTKSAFQIPIYNQLAPLLEKRLEKSRSKGRSSHADLVFSIKNCRKAIATACTRLGYPNFTARSLRRMFIERAIGRGVSIKTIAESQGHTDGGKLILDTYSYLSRDALDEMAKMM